MCESPAICDLALFKLQMGFVQYDKTNTVKLVMFACSKYCVFFIFSFMRVLINESPPINRRETEGTDLCVF